MRISLKLTWKKIPYAIKDLNSNKRYEKKSKVLQSVCPMFPLIREEEKMRVRTPVC